MQLASTAATQIITRLFTTVGLHKAELGEWRPVDYPNATSESLNVFQNDIVAEERYQDG